MAVVLGLIVLEKLEHRPRTSDAYLQANLVHMAPDVSGRIVELRIRNNQLVEADGVLLVIDPTPYRLRVKQAQAQVRMLEAELANLKNQVASQTSRAEAAATSVATAQAKQKQAKLTLARLVPLQPPGYVSAQQVDEARTEARTATTSLQQAEQEARAAREGITSIQATEEQLAEAKVTLAMDERDLRLTTVRAPCAGRITGLTIAAGEYATTGKSIFTIIDTTRWWAVGDFRETDLAGLRDGQRAKVFVMSDPYQPVAGVVDSQGWAYSRRGARRPAISRPCRAA